MLKRSMDDLNRKSVNEFHSSEKHPVVVILENIRSMQNVGSVFRTADAFLIDRICLTGYTPHPPHRDIHKTALGATDTVSWKGYSSTSDAIHELKANDFKVYAVEQVKGSNYLHEFVCDSHDRIALLFGNEATGVEEHSLSLCDGSIEIPQFGMKHSLNISVAAGVVLWEVIRKMKWTQAENKQT